MNIIIVLLVIGVVGLVVYFFTRKNNAPTPTPVPTEPPQPTAYPIPTPIGPTGPIFDGHSPTGITTYTVYGEVGNYVTYVNATGVVVTETISKDSIVINAKDGFGIDGDFISIQAESNQ